MCADTNFVYSADYAVAQSRVSQDKCHSQQTRGSVMSLLSRKPYIVAIAVMAVAAAVSVVLR